MYRWSIVLQRCVCWDGPDGSFTALSYPHTQEAEEFAEQDKAVKARVDAKNQLETYAYNIKSTVEDKAKDKVSAEDKKTVLEAVKEALEWVEENPEADADEFNDKRKEVRERETHTHIEWGGEGEGTQRQRGGEEGEGLAASGLYGVCS